MWERAHGEMPLKYPNKLSRWSRLHNHKINNMRYRSPFKKN
jgi:hypothetical protein